MLFKSKQRVILTHHPAQKRLLTPPFNTMGIIKDKKTEQNITSGSRGEGGTRRSPASPPPSERPRTYAFLNV